MADIKVNELPTATPALTDKLFGIGASEEYQAEISGVANVVLKNYSNSSLETTSKNVVGAINELNDTTNRLEETTNEILTGANEVISEATANWLDENVTPTGSAVAVDSSLEIAGAAADSKTVGDKFDTIDETFAEMEQTIEDSTATDATLSVSGKPADAKATGDAVNDLKSDFDYINKGFGNSLSFYPIPITGHGKIPCNKNVGETVNLSDIRYSDDNTIHHWIVPCVEGDKLTVTVDGGNQTFRAFAFLDENNAVLYITAKQTATIDSHVFTAPAGTAKALIQNVSAVIPTQYFGVYTNFEERVEAIENLESELSQKIDNSLTITSSDTVPFRFEVGKDYLVTNNSLTSISFRTRLSPDASNVEIMSVNSGIAKIFTCTQAADGINIYISSGTIDVTVEQMDDLEYRVTDNSKRLDTLESDGVPSYFRSMMDEKLPTILDNMGSVGINGDTFIFITDIHWANNAKNSLGLIKYIINNTNINKVICGGDIISQGEKSTMMKHMNIVIKGLEFPYHNDLLVAFGNHDSNILSSVENAHFDVGTCYALMNKEMESYVTMMTDYDLSFYYDNPTNKVRYIVLDTGEDSSTTGRVFTAYDEFAAALLTTPQDWNIVVVGHIVTYGRFLYVRGMIGAYNSRSTYTNVNVGTYNFSDAVGNVVCVFGGHTHIDSIDTTDAVPVIVTGTDSNRVSENDYPYVLGTDQEQLFDVVTLDFTNKVIKCVRVGRGEDRTINYQ